MVCTQVENNTGMLLYYNFPVIQKPAFEPQKPVIYATYAYTQNTVIYRATATKEGVYRYTYVVNNPLVYTDPTGDWFGWDDLVVAGIGFAIGYVSHGITSGNWGGDALISGGIGAGVAWLGYNTAGIATAGSGQLNSAMWKFAGNYALNSAASQVMPSVNVPLGNNFSVSVGPGVMFGSHSFLGANASLNYSDADISLGIGGSFGYGSNGWGGTKGWGGGLGWSAGKNFGNGLSASVGQNLYMGKDMQLTGRLGVRYNEWSLNYENDHYTGDKYKTAALSINYKGEYGDYGAGFNLYTNKSSGRTIESQTMYTGAAHGIEGLAYLRAGNYYAGYRSPGIGKAIQNSAHHLMGLPRWTWDWRAMNGPLLMYKTPNPFSNW